MDPISYFDKPVPGIAFTTLETETKNEIRQSIDHFSRVVQEMFTESNPATSSTRKLDLMNEFRDSLIPGLAIHEYPDEKGSPVIAMSCKLKPHGSSSQTIEVVLTLRNEGKSTYQVRIQSSTNSNIFVEKPLTIKNTAEMTAIARNISDKCRIEYQKTLTPTSGALCWEADQKVKTLDVDDFVMVSETIEQTLLQGESSGDDVVMVDPVILKPFKDLTDSMRSGNTEAVKKHMEWLKNNSELNSQQITELLKMKGPDGESGLVQMLKQGHSEAAHAYFFGLSLLQAAKKITDEEFVQLLVGDNTSGIKAFIENCGGLELAKYLPLNAQEELHSIVSNELSKYLMQSKPSEIETLMLNLSTLTEHLNAEGRKWLNMLIYTIATSAYNKDNDYLNRPTQREERKLVFNSALDWQRDLVKKGLLESSVFVQTVKDIMHNPRKFTEGAIKDAESNITMIITNMASYLRSHVISKNDFMNLFQTTKTVDGEEFVFTHYDNPGIMTMYFSFLKDFYTSGILTSDNLMSILRNLDEQGLPKTPDLLHSMYRGYFEPRRVFFKGVCDLSDFCITPTQLASIIEARDQQNIRGVVKAISNNHTFYVKEFFDKLLFLEKNKYLTPECIAEMAVGPGSNNTLLSTSQPVYNKAALAYIKGLFKLQQAGILDKDNLFRTLKSYTQISAADISHSQQINQLIIAIAITFQNPPSPERDQAIKDFANNLLYIAIGATDKVVAADAMKQMIRCLKAFDQPTTTYNISVLLQKVLTNPETSLESYLTILDLLCVMNEKWKLTAYEINEIINHGEEHHVSFMDSVMSKSMISHAQSSHNRENNNEIIIKLLQRLHTMANNNYISNLTLFKELLGRNPHGRTNFEIATSMNMIAVINALFDCISASCSAQTLTQAQAMQLVLQKNSEGMPLLSQTFIQSNQNTQNAYINGLYKLVRDKNLSPTELYQIFASTDSHGNNALANALIHNRPEAISNYISRLKEAGFTSEQLMQLLTLHNSESNSEFIAKAGGQAFLDAHDEAWLSYCQSLEASGRDLMLTTEQLRDLMAANKS